MFKFHAIASTPVKWDDKPIPSSWQDQEVTSACDAKIGIECQIYSFVHETLWLFVASMKQEVLSVEPTYERVQSI